MAASFIDKKNIGLCLSWRPNQGMCGDGPEFGVRVSKDTSCSFSSTPNSKYAGSSQLFIVKVEAKRSGDDQLFMTYTISDDTAAILQCSAAEQCF